MSRILADVRWRSFCTVNAYGDLESKFTPIVSFDRCSMDLALTQPGSPCLNQDASWLELELVCLTMPNARPGRSSDVEKRTAAVACTNYGCGCLTFQTNSQAIQAMQPRNYRHNDVIRSVINMFHNNPSLQVTKIRDTTDRRHQVGG